MRMKSYFADSVQVAMERARRELGAEAVLVTSRAASPEARHLGGYEVVFATELPERNAPAPTPESSPRPGSRPAAPRLAPHSVESMVSEFQNLRRQFQSWRQAGLRSGDRPRWISAHPGLDELYDELAQQEVDRELIQKLLSAAEGRAQSSGVPARLSGAVDFHASSLLARREAPANPEQLRSAVAEEIQAAVRTDATLGTGSTGPQIVALVGPPGSGKTATIAKLAVQYGLSARKPAILLSFDTLRVAASEQLRSYAGLLGIGFQVLDTNRALAQSLEEHRGKELILIDTAGFSFRDLEGGTETAAFLAGRDDIQKHLVLPATMRTPDLLRYAAAYEEFRPSRLIFTRLDETDAFGTILSESIRSGLPLSFFGTGQLVPEDLEAASGAALSSRMLPGREDLPVPQTQTKGAAA